MNQERQGWGRHQAAGPQPPSFWTRVPPFPHRTVSGLEQLPGGARGPALSGGAWRLPLAAPGGAAKARGCTSAASESPGDPSPTTACAQDVRMGPSSCRTRKSELGADRAPPGASLCRWDTVFSS